MPYLWQMNSWPDFQYKLKNILPNLSNARIMQGRIKALSSNFNLENIGELITQEALNTSAIEGEKLDPSEIRSSVAIRLGLPNAGLPSTGRHEGLVEVLLDAVVNFNEDLSREKLWAWHSALFPGGYSSNLKNLKVGAWREGKTDMNLISGELGHERIHYTAPPSEQVPGEMDGFINWWKKTQNPEFDGLLRAGIAHLYFMTVHPFEDGNGRIGRALTDLALAQDEQTGTRLYSLSSQIHKDRKKYYKILEETQNGEGNIEYWLNWFLKEYSASIDQSITIIEGSLLRQRFFTRIGTIPMNARQTKVIEKMALKLPEEYVGGMTTRKYSAIAKTSPDTSKRDIADLLNKGVLIPGKGKGRSTHYLLKIKE